MTKEALNAEDAEDAEEEHERNVATTGLWQGVLA
jgi:hypothetical protein